MKPQMMNKSMEKHKPIVVDLLDGCHIRVCDWNEGIMYWDSLPIVNQWSGTIKIQVGYPFEKKSVIEIEKGSKDTWRNDLIISAIKERLEYMYSRSRSNGFVPGTLNEDWKGEFGQSFHRIEDLWIDGLYFNLDTGIVEVCMGS